VPPVVVATFQPFTWWWRIRRITPEPLVNVIVIGLLTPDHTGISLALDHFQFAALQVLLELCIKTVGFSDSCLENFIESTESIRHSRRTESESVRNRFSRSQLCIKMKSGPGSRLLRVNRFFAVQYKIINPVFIVVPILMGSTIKPDHIGFIFTKKNLACAFRIEHKLSQFVFGKYAVVGHPLQGRFFNRIAPGPDIAQPEMRQYMNCSFFRSAVADGNSH